MGVRSSQPRSPNLNKTDGHLLEYFRQNFGAGGGGTNYVAPVQTGLTATGGVISDYTTSPGDVYRAHVFTATGTFDVSEIGTYPAQVDFLVVGGGGGGSHAGAGGGATGPGGPNPLYFAKQNSGSGGGGSTSTPWPSGTNYSGGGSGIVLIAYPS